MYDAKETLTDKNAEIERLRSDVAGLVKYAASLEAEIEMLKTEIANGKADIDRADHEIDGLRYEVELLRAALRPHQEAAIKSMVAEAQRLKLP